MTAVRASYANGVGTSSSSSNYSGGVHSRSSTASVPDLRAAAAASSTAASSSNGMQSHLRTPSSSTLQQQQRKHASHTSSQSPGASASIPSLPPGSRINLVTYRTSTIKALIDPSLPVSDVIRQLCANAHLGVQEPPALFALRDEETEELIDDNNMAKKIENGKNFKLCSSPTIEAVEMVDRLSSRDERVIKMATYTLQRLVREQPFVDEFLARGGLNELLQIIERSASGNTLAYALVSCQNLMEGRDHGWETLSSDFIARVVHILVSQERVNVCRPATAILKKLVTSGPDNLPAERASHVPQEAIDGGAAPDADTSATIYRYGFDVVYREIQSEPAFLSTLVQRLESADTTLRLYSLSLINSLVRNVSNSSFDGFTSELERLGVSRAIARFMDSHSGDDLTTSILEFQNTMIRVYHRRLRTPVTAAEKRHVSALSYIWLQAKVPELPAPQPPPDKDTGEVLLLSGPNAKLKWRQLGFDTENVVKEFARVGWLGLNNLEAFVRSDPEVFAKTALEQTNRPADRRCPLGRASVEVTEILADHWGIEAGYATSTDFLPFLFFLQKVHHLGLKFFLRMWAESGAASTDFSRVSALVRSQLREALRGEVHKTWFEVERDLLESEYRIVRARQMRELEVEDDFASKASIRNLRARLYRESFEFVRQQRIQCLLEGAWFQNVLTAQHTGGARTIGGYGGGRMRSGSASGSVNAVTSALHAGAPKLPWRFCRLSPNRRYLYYRDAYERGPIRGGLDDLPEKLDLSLLTDVSLGGVGGGGASNTAAGGDGASLSLTLLRAPDDALAELIALNQSQYAEWTDGLNMLRSDEAANTVSVGAGGPGGMATGVVSTKETADYIQILTDIGVKVKLLDLTGEQIDIPVDTPAAPVPITTDFFFNSF